MIMKNLIRKMLLVMCVAALALAFTACGKSDKPAPKAVEKEEPAEDEAEEPEEPVAENEEDASDLPASGKYATLEDFINSDMMQEQLDSQIASLEGTGLTAEVIAEDNKLVYSFTITDPNVAAALDAASLQSTLDSQASTFESIASMIPLAVEIDNPVVVVRYLDSAGAVIVSQEFAPPAE